MPAQQRARGDQSAPRNGHWEVARRRRKQCAIGRAKLRPRHLGTQNVRLVAQDQQLEVLHVQTAATSDERSQQRPEREVEERDGHIADPPQTRRYEVATRLLAPFRPAQPLDR
jgi:hypothetical protein